jgi:acetylornithine deacetylase/succinyl-diaminopimelate desuccinylase-like protein
VAALLALAAVVGPTSAPARDEHPVPTILAAQTADTSVAYSLLSELVTRFGARPAGSPAEHAAAAWLAGQLRAFGFEGVNVETFPIERWSPGVTSVTVTTPQSQTLVATPLGGLVAGSPVEAPVVAFASYDAFLAAPADTVRGRIVAVLEPLPRTVDGSGYLRMAVIRARGPGEAMKRGAAGFVMRSLATHRSRIASSGATTPLARPFPAFALSPPDAEQLARLSAQGPVSLRLASSANWIGPATSQNVVASVPGRDPAAPPILISAHLDSWEQGTGAIDNGFGIAAVIGAAKRILDSPERPLRSIKLVLFGAEEVTQPDPVQNFAGARAYLVQHRDELAQLNLASESDWGGGLVTRLRYPAAGDQELQHRLSEALAPLGVQVVPEMRGPGTPDAEVLAGAGVPLFRLDQDASTLFDTHHNPNDTLAVVDREVLDQNMAAWAVSVWLLANAAQLTADR